MRHLNYARRKARGGCGVIPPNPAQWENEHNGLDLREDLGIGPGNAFPHEQAFGLLPNVIVLPHGSLPAAAKYLQHFRIGRASAWSGMAMTLPTGDELVIFNDSHPRTRVRATLMEEFFHLWLDHPRSVLRLYSDDGAWRSYAQDVEQAAYGSGAAALVPYCSLRSMIRAGRSVGEIAAHFGVSNDLVLFRCKVTKTYRKLGRRA